MNSILLLLALLSPLSLYGPPVPADDGEAGEKSLWVEDASGLRQWKAFDGDCDHCLGEGKETCERCVQDWQPEKCAECKRKELTTCRRCAGKGKELNPLEQQICFFCQGSALYICSNCSGRGKYQVGGGSRKGQKCGPCKGSGLLDCLACKGKRVISVVKVGKGPGEAKASQLESAREVLFKARAQMRGYSATGRESHDSKTFDQAIKKALGTLPALKQVQKMRDASMKALRVSAAYVSYEDEVIDEFKRIRGRTLKLLDGQIQLIDTCLKRLEHNEGVESK